MRGDYASVGATGLSTEVPLSRYTFVFGRPDPRPLYAHDVFFTAQSLGDKTAIVLTVGCD
jgi:hypothetical protein